LIAANSKSKTESKLQILLVEDDRMIGLAVQQALVDAGYGVHWVRDGRDACGWLITNRCHLMLLDLGLPGLNGLEVLRAARSDAAIDPQLPILIISARDAVPQRIEGLDAGADDYLIKPFDVSELLARVRVLVRRGHVATSSRLEAGNLVLDLASKEASYEGSTLRLSRREVDLLCVLMRRPGAIFSRAEIERQIYGRGGDIESNVVEFIIHGLRRKLGHSVIKNIRGLGWYVGTSQAA
jgi:two-component system OmpR family response regulator